MGTQAQAFRAYYASMTDAKLLETARNRNSFVAPAQAALAEELAKRKLAPSEERHEASRPSTIQSVLRRFKHAS